MKFSILIPTKDRQHLFEKAYKSAVNQQCYTDYEIVISDCGETPVVLPDVEVDKSFPPVIVTRPLVENADIFANWNHGINSCNGENIIILGDDDALTPNALVSIAHRDVIDHDIIGLVNAWYGHSCDTAGRSGKLKFDWNWKGNHSVNPTEIVNQFCTFSRVLFSPTHFAFKRHLLDEPLQIFGIYPDYSLLHRLAIRANSAYVMDIPTVIHGYSGGSSGNQFGKREKYEWDGVKFINSPVKGFTFTNGRLETALKVCNAEDALLAKNIDMEKFSDIYMSEILSDSLWRDTYQDLDGCFFLREAYLPKVSPKHDAILASIMEMNKCRIWEALDGVSVGDFSYVGGNIVSVSETLHIRHREIMRIKGFLDRCGIGF